MKHERIFRNSHERQPPYPSTFKSKFQIMPKNAFDTYLYVTFEMKPFEWTWRPRGRIEKI